MRNSLTDYGVGTSGTGAEGTRRDDPRFTKALLYQLSYAGIVKNYSWFQYRVLTDFALDPLDEENVGQNVAAIIPIHQPLFLQSTHRSLHGRGGMKSGLL